MLNQQRNLEVRTGTAFIWCPLLLRCWKCPKSLVCLGLFGFFFCHFRIVTLLKAHNVLKLELEQGSQIMLRCVLKSQNLQK